MTISDSTLAQLDSIATQRGLTTEQLLQEWLALHQEQPLERMALIYRAVQYSPVSLLITDALQPDEPIIYVNPAFETNTGYSEAEALGQNCCFMSRDDRQQEGLEQIRHALKNNTPVTVRLRNYCKDGSQFWNELQLAPIYDSAGRVTNHVGVQTDITEAYQQRLELTNMQQLFRGGPVVVFRWKSETDSLRSLKEAFVSVNVAQWGYQAEDFTQGNKRWLDIIHPEDRERVFNEIAHFRRQKVAQGEQTYRILTAQGDIRWIYDFTIAFYDDPYHEMARGYLLDITDLKETQAKIAESEARFRLLADAAPIMIWTSDFKKHCDYFNQRWLAFTGRPLEAELGLGWTERIYPDDREFALATCSTAFHQRQPFRMEYRLLRHDGEYRWLLDEGVPRYMPDGAFAGYIGVCIDVTEQRATQTDLETRVKERTQELFVLNQELASSEIRYHALLEALPIAISAVNRQGQISFTNGHAESLFRLKQKDIEQRHFDSPEWRHTDLVGNPLPHDQQPFVQIMTTRQPLYNFQHAIEDKDGTRIVLSISGVPLFDSGGEIDEVIFAIEDVTLRRKWEEGLQTTLAEEKRLGELKNRFISMISHEFRTPLSVIMTSTELLRLQEAMLDSDKRLARLKRIAMQVNRLTGMLEDVTHVYKMQTQALALFPESLDLSHLLQQLVEEAQLAYPDSQVQISLQVNGSPQSFRGDERLLYQLFMNLLSNAVKYSPPFGQVHLGLTYADDHIQVVIQDQGVGIPPEEQTNLFSLFYRASNVSHIPGTGLGLVIAKQAAEAHHGHLEFESQPSQGSTFRVRLPLGAPLMTK
jgi:PAS domain S-box-containing protein